MRTLSLPSTSIRLFSRLLLLAVFNHVGADSMPAMDPSFPQAAPSGLGMKLPRGEPKTGDGRHVLLEKDPDVCKVYLEVGDAVVVIRSDGRLISAPTVNTQRTERPFEPMDKTVLARRLLQHEFSGFRTKQTKRYLYVYNSSDIFVRGTSRILETMYPGLFNYCNRLGLSVADPEFPLVVVIFRTEKEFQKYRRMPDGVVAYYNSLSNHVVMYEQSELTNMAPELALKQSVSTIAHEGVHQVLHNIGVQKRLSRWPLWISEGLAEYFAPTDFKKRIHWKGVGFANDLRMRELFDFYDRSLKGQSSHGQLIRSTIQSNAMNSLGYASSWATVNYLAKREREKFAAYMQDVSQLEPLKSKIPGELFRKHFGSDFAKLETGMLKHLKTLPYRDPVEYQTHYVVFSRAKNKRPVIVTTSRSKVREFQNENNSKNVRIKVFASRSQAKEFAEYWARRR